MRDINCNQRGGGSHFASAAHWQSRRLAAPTVEKNQGSEAEWWWRIWLWAQNFHHLGVGVPPVVRTPKRAGGAEPHPSEHRRPSCERRLRASR